MTQHSIKFICLLTSLKFFDVGSHVDYFFNLPQSPSHVGLRCIPQISRMIYSNHVDIYFSAPKMSILFDLKQNLFWNNGSQQHIITPTSLSGFHLGRGLGGLNIHNLTLIPIVIKLFLCVGLAFGSLLQAVCVVA